jgi:phosphinothricin acetyltransferase
VTALRVRAVRPGDAAALAALYRPYVIDTPISFEVDPPDAAEMARRVARVTASYPWLVAEIEGKVVGYACADRFRERAAYRWIVETSIYLAQGCERQGIGRALYQPLLAALTAQGFVSAIAAIALPNPASVALHEAVGFVRVGAYQGVGFKAGAWLDVGLWQRDLAARDAEPEEPALP